MAPCEGTANEVSYEWSHQTLSLTDSDVSPYKIYYSFWEAINI